MSTDIHLHVEVLVNGTWQHYAQLRPRQHYDVFEKMAGVRGDPRAALAPLRGIPKDATLLTRLDAAKWHNNGHSFTWLNSDEIAELSNWFENESALNYFSFECWVGTYLYDNGLGALSRYPDDYPDWLNDVRFVFWFDS